MDKIELPPLPEPAIKTAHPAANAFAYGYHADQLTAYARAALAPVVAERAIARALEAAPKVGEGFVVVPVEPTAEMRAAHAMYGDTSDWWNAVIAAAPTPPTTNQADPAKGE